MQAQTRSAMRSRGDLITFFRSVLVILHMSSNACHDIRASAIMSIIRLHFFDSFQSLKRPKRSAIILPFGLIALATFAEFS